MTRTFLLLSTLASAFLFAASPATAYEINISIKGAGTVDEDTSLTQANLINPSCSTPQTTATGVVGVSTGECNPGTTTGDYGYGWTVRWKATPAEGWDFVQWESDGRSNPPYRTCDGQSGATYASDSCQFGTFDNYQMRAVFADTTAPTASITGGPAQGSISARDVTFTFGAVGQPSGQPVNYRCKLTGPSGVVQDWTSCSTAGKTYSGLSDGGHTFEVEAKDPSGNFTTASRAWSVDAIQPETTLTADGPAEGSTVASNSASFQWTGSADTQKYFCQIDTGTVVDPCTSPRSTGTLSDGPHTFKVWALDTHGNVESSPAMRSWTIDTTPPDTSIDGGPADGSSTSSTDASFTFSGAGAGGSYVCQLDAATPASCTSPQNFSGLALGQHTFRVWARDAVNNQDPSEASRTWTVTAAPDTTPPNTLIDNGPGQDSSTESTSATFEFSATEAGSFECRLDGSGFEPCNSPKAYAGLAVGTHTFQVRATDGSGNVDGSPSTRTWTITSPVITGTTDTSAVLNSGNPLVQVITTAAKVESTLSTGFAAFKRYTIFRKLIVRRVPSGGAIQVACRGKKCPARRIACRGKKCPARSFTKQGSGDIRLTKFIRKRLTAGTTLEIRVTKIGYIGKVFRLKVRAGKAPTVSSLCLVPGEAQPRKC